MSRELVEARAERERYSLSRSTRLQVFVETIVRAGLSAIPVVGAALEKASFGYKDALSSQELLDLVRATESELRTQKSTEQPLSDDDIARITNSILDSPKFAGLADKIQAASIQSMAVLVEILQQVAHMGVTIEESAHRAMLEHADIRREQQEIRRTIERSVVREEALLHEILARLDQTAALYNKGPAELLEVLESTRVKKMLQSAGHIGAGARHFEARHPMGGGAPFVGSDLSEILGYIDWPIRDQELFLADAALFEIGADSVYLLPGTLEELSSWLQNQVDQVLSNMGAIASGKIEKTDCLFHSSSPIARLQRLFHQGRVSAFPWQVDANFSLSRLLYLTEVSVEAMCAKTARKSRLAITRDCENLAFLGVAVEAEVLNHRVPVLVSRDDTLLIAERALRDVCALTTKAPVVVHPIEWSYDMLLRHGATAHPKATVSQDGETIEGLMLKLRGIVSDPSPDSVVGLAQDLPILKDSLGRYCDYFTDLSTWFIRDVRWESHIRAEKTRTEEWLREMLLGQTEAMNALTDIESHVQKMMEAYEPFLRT